MFTRKISKIYHLVLFIHIILLHCKSVYSSQFINENNNTILNQENKTEAYIDSHLPKIVENQNPFLYNPTNKKKLKNSIISIAKKNSLIEKKYFNENGELFKIEFINKNNQLKKILNYKNGKKNGLNTNYYENKNIQNQGNYLNGKKNGYWQYYYQNGAIKGKGFFFNGLEHGKWIFYNKRGSVEKEKIFKTGVEQNFFNKYLKKIFKTNVKQNRDVITLFSKFKKCKTNSIYINYPSGRVKSCSEYSSSNKNGLTLGFYKNGNIQYSGFFLNNQRYGKWIYFFNNGKVRQIINF
jgi:antitoxin component YwqK of YwqJK toxin-antitoxin module